MKENEVSYRILYIDGERIISEESVIGSNSILEQLESIIAKIELSKPTGQLQSITDIPNNTGNSFNIFRKLRFQRIKFKQKLFKILFYKLLLGYKPSSESHIACFYVERIITSPPIV